MDKINFKTNNKNINNLIGQLKKKSGRDVEIFFGEMTIGVNETLMSRIINGVPEIIVKHGYNFTEEEIYHESFHLLIRIENGIYDFKIGGNLLDFLKVNIQGPMAVLSKTHSILHHAYFFQKMINNEFSPGKYLENQLKDRIEQYKCVYPNDKDIHNILDVWHIALSMEDKNLNTELYLEKLRGFNQNNYDQGMKLLAISKSFTDPNKESDVFCNILKELLNYTNNVKYSKIDLSVTYE